MVESGDDMLNSIVTWLLVVLGWLFVEVCATKRAYRQEELAIVQKLEARLEALRVKAAAYYARAVPCVSDGLSLKMDLQTIAATVTLLRIRHPNSYDLAGDLIELRQAVTDGTFECVRPSDLSPDEQRMHRIAGAIQGLTQAVYREFEFANGWWGRRSRLVAT